MWWKFHGNSHASAKWNCLLTKLPVCMQEVHRPKGSHRLPSYTPHSWMLQHLRLSSGARQDTFTRHLHGDGLHSLGISMEKMHKWISLPIDQCLSALVNWQAKIIYYPISKLGYINNMCFVWVENLPIYTTPIHVAIVFASRRPETNGRERIRPQQVCNGLKLLPLARWDCSL